MKKFRWEVIYFIIAVMLTFFVISSGDFFRKKIHIEIGQIASETIEAPFQVENEIATERKRNQLEALTPVSYTHLRAHETR